MFKICEWSCLGRHSLYRAILQELHERTESLEQKAEIIRELNEQPLGLNIFIKSSLADLRNAGGEPQRLTYSRVSSGNRTQKK